MTTIEREQLKAQLVKHEGLRLQIHRDAHGIETIGVGRNLRDRGLTGPEAMFLLHNDIAEIEVQLRRALPWFGALDGVRQGALIDMGMAGVSTLLGCTPMLDALERKDFLAAKRAALASSWRDTVGLPRATTVAEMLHTGVAPQF